MPVLNIELDAATLEGLRAIATENGIAAPEQLLRREAERLVHAYRGPGLSPEFLKCLKESIEENRNVLERLAK